VEENYGFVPPDQAVRLLAHLASDDGVRDEAIKDPVGLLRKYGIDAPQGAIRPGNLPSKKLLARLLVIVLDDEDITGESAMAIVYFVFGHAMPIVEADASR
jgi:hypothetical protein